MSTMWLISRPGKTCCLSTLTSRFGPPCGVGGVDLRGDHRAALWDLDLQVARNREHVDRRGAGVEPHQHHRVGVGRLERLVGAVIGADEEDRLRVPGVRNLHVGVGDRRRQRDVRDELLELQQARHRRGRGRERDHDHAGDREPDQRAAAATWGSAASRAASLDRLEPAGLPLGRRRRRPARSAARARSRSAPGDSGPARPPTPTRRARGGRRPRARTRPPGSRRPGTRPHPRRRRVRRSVLRRGSSVPRPHPGPARTGCRGPPTPAAR